MGFPLPLPLPHVSVREVRLKVHHQVVTLRGEPQLVIYERSCFDAYLADQARARGIEIRQGETVQEFAFERGGVRLRTPRATYYAKVVVGADGANGITRRWMRRRASKARLARTLEVIQAASFQHPLFGEQAAVFDFSFLKERLQGYLWEFPFLKDGQAALNRGIYDARVDRKKPLQALPQLLHSALAGSELPLAHAWQSHPIHWFSPRNCFSIPHLLLVGDAAGVDPLFGEGIGPALAYGRIAAQAICEAFESGDFSLSNYRPLLKKSYLGRYLMTRWFTAVVCYRLAGQSWFPPLVWTLGKFLARLFPPPEPLYSSES